MAFEVRLLGELAAILDGHPVALTGARARSLLALLVLNRNRAVSTDALVSRLWPDEPPLTAIKTVQVYVSRLRRLLGPEANRLASSAGGYAFQLADDELDAARFEKLFRDARQQLASGERLRARASLDAAMAQWRGQALADLATEAFARGEAERLEELRVQALEDLVSLAIEDGQARSTIGVLRAAAREHPTRERLWGQLMLALYADGRQAEALATYHEARRHLEDELGLDPSRELQALEHRILTQDASLLPATQTAQARDQEPARPTGGTTSLDDGPVQPDPEPGRLRRTVTVLAVALGGGSELAQKLDPEALDGILARLVSGVRTAIERHGGEFVRAESDSMLAVFGVRRAHEDDALRAARAATEVLDAINEVDADIVRRWGHGVRAGVALDTGEVVTRDGAPVGMVTRTAARLAETASGNVVMTATTNRLVRRGAETSGTGSSGSLPGETFRLVRMYRTERVAPRPATAFVGRKREMSRLRQAFAASVEAPSCQLFTLLGSAGVGKSRLVQEFVATLEPEVQVLRGRCLPYGDGITYWPIAEICRTAAGIGDADTPELARAKLERWLSGLRDAGIVSDRVATAIGLSPQAVPKEEVFWAIRMMLEHLARSTPVVVIIEDIHWAEPTLLDLIEHIAERARDARILILCPARPELLEVRPSWGGGLVNATTALLEPLDPAEAGQMISSLPGGAALPAELRSRILETSEGNALFVEEILGMFVDESLLSEAADGTWTAATSLALVRIPDSISAVLAARLDRLAPNERAVAERASVVGRVFEEEAVTELADDVLRPEVTRSLIALVRKELVRPDRSELSAGDAYRFRHVLIRDAAYGAMPKAERAELHGRFARWLERRAGPRLSEYQEIVGHHYEAAYLCWTELGVGGAHVEDLATRAAASLSSAGERAFERADMPAAEGLLARAVELMPIGSVERLSLMPDRGFALFSSGRITEATSLLEAAIAEATDAGSSRYRTRAELELGLVRILAAGEHRASRQIAEARLPAIEHDGDLLGLARANLVIACADWIGGRVQSAVQARARAIELSTRAGEPQTERWNSFSGAECYGPEPALAAIGRLETVVTSAGDPMTRAQALFSLAGLYAMRGRASDSRHACEDMYSILDERTNRIWSITAPAEMGGVSELINGDPAAAEKWLSEGIARLDGIGASGYQSTLKAIKAVAYAQQGRLDEALASADQAALEGSSEDLLLHVTAETGRALAYTGLGELTRAVDAGRRAVDLAEQTDWISYHADALLALSQALKAGDEFDAAHAAALRARALFEAKQHLTGEHRARQALLSLPK